MSENMSMNKQMMDAAGRMLAADAAGAGRPFVIYNEDPDNIMYAYWHKDPEHYTEAEIRAYVRKVIGAGNVSHFFACVNARVSSYPSKVAPNLWDALGQPGYDPPKWLKAAKDLVVDQGVDQFRIYIEECRRGGVSPWLSVRMNDIHFPYATNSYRNIGFWKEHPELWIDPSAKDRTDGPWGDRAFDYRKEPVQQYMLAYIDEALSRYDADGIELDWMRFEHHAPRAVARTEGAARINDFMRKAKAIVARHEKARGHRILIAGRVDTEPESALNHGTDYRTWAKEGLVDWLIPCNFFQTVDFDLPFAKWAAELKGLNPQVLVIPGLDNGVWRNGPWSRGRLTADEYAAWADRMFRQGATGVYLFNFFGMHVYSKLEPDPVCWDFVIKEGLTPENVARHAQSMPDDPPRECVVFGWCPPKEKVLFLSAHPDDIISSLGTCLLMRDKFEIHVVDFTHGERGLGEAGCQDGSTKAIRTKEEAAVMRSLGARLHWLDQVDGDSWVERKTCEALANLIQTLLPRAIFGHWPIDMHMDHMMSAATLQKAVRMTGYNGEYYFFEESFDSKGFPDAFYVDITSVAAEKERLIRLYVCQNQDDSMCKEEMRNSRMRAGRLWPPRMDGYAEAFASYVGRPQGPCIFAEIPRDPVGAEMPGWGR